MALRRAGTKAKWESFCRQGIREAVVRLISREGTSALTMDRVAAEAGVAKGTLYVYYKDKADLLESVKDASMQPMREELFAILEGALAPDEKIRRFIERHLGYLDANRDFFRVLLWDRQIAQTRLKRHQTARYRSYVDRIARVIEEGIGLGLFRPMGAVKVAAMLIETDMAMIAQRLWSETPSPVEEDAELLFALFTHGIAAGAAPVRKSRADIRRTHTPGPKRTSSTSPTQKPGTPPATLRKDRTL